MWTWEEIKRDWKGRLQNYDFVCYSNKKIGKHVTVSKAARIDGLAWLGQSVLVEKDVDIRPGALIYPQATLCNGCTVAECAVIKEGATIGEHSMVGYKVVIGEYATLGQQCCIRPNVCIGDHVSIKASSDVPWDITSQDSYVIIDNIGSRNDRLLVIRTPEMGLLYCTGCFTGSEAQLRKRLRSVEYKTRHAPQRYKMYQKQYFGAIAYAKSIL